MSELGEAFAARRVEQQKKRASNREASPKFLEEAGFTFASKNAGAHLIVATKVGLVDFWPGTGLFICREELNRKGRKLEGRGVRNLMKLGSPE